MSMIVCVGQIILSYSTCMLSSLKLNVEKNFFALDLQTPLSFDLICTTWLNDFYLFYYHK